MEQKTTSQMFREYIDIVAEQDKAKDEDKDKGKDREYSYNDPADLDKRIPVDEDKHYAGGGATQKSGQNVDQNPHKKGSKEYDSWKKGWVDSHNKKQEQVDEGCSDDEEDSD